MTRDYYRIADAIDFLTTNSVAQPTLDQLAEHVHLSPHHFHRMFVRYCGVTPKQFLQVLTVRHAKQILDRQKPTMEAALASGLSGNNRLYDHFVNIEAITPGEYKTKGRGVNFSWGTAATVFGDAFIAWTAKGIHRIEFVDTAQTEGMLARLKRSWPQASFTNHQEDAGNTLNKIFTGVDEPFNLWVAGTNFQIMVWKALLAVHPGELRTYQFIARSIDRAGASRAVGTAIGNNPIAYLIPCHRVIQSSGALGGYRWSASRKRTMLARETLTTNTVCPAEVG